MHTASKRARIYVTWLQEKKMLTCPFFETGTRTFRRNPIRPDRQPLPAQSVTYAWCEHPKHSPIDKEDATDRFINGAFVLKCEGDPERCQLTPEEYSDM